jgi:hypothetical protein
MTVASTPVTSSSISLASLISHSFNKQLRARFICALGILLLYLSTCQCFLFCTLEQKQLQVSENSYGLWLMHGSLSFAGSCLKAHARKTMAFIFFNTIHQ